MKDAVILDEKSILRALARIAHEIVERNHGVEDVCLVGVKRRGIPLAQHLAKLIYDFEGVEVPVGELDITWYRDDLSHEDKDPTLNAYNIPFSIQDKVVVIVDDVIYTGRTARAALDQLIDIARPKRVQLAVLVDRGHRELPLRPDYVGKNLPTSHKEVVKVMLPPYEEEYKVMLFSE